MRYQLFLPIFSKAVGWSRDNAYESYVQWKETGVHPFPVMSEDAPPETIAILFAFSS
jgi:hypothetical protein